MTETKFLLALSKTVKAYKWNRTTLSIERGCGHHNHNPSSTNQNGYLLFDKSSFSFLRYPVSVVD